MPIVDAYGQPYGDAIAQRKPAGAILLDGQHVADTVRCVHCGGHFVMRRGSGRQRGFCLKCEGITCGAAECLACVPAERRLEMMEARR